MQIKYFTIAGGNKTALVWDCPIQDRAEQTRNLLPHVEQVGFVTDSQLTMMGSELCINALLALATQMETSEGILEMSPLKNIRYKKLGNKTQLTITLPYAKIDDLILLGGIGFICTQEKNLVTSQALKTYAEQYKLPAFGVLLYDNGARIFPKVYVAQTDSVIDETACGSGSVAAHLMTGHNNIVQPTGEIISISSEGDTFCIEAAVSTLP